LRLPVGGSRKKAALAPAFEDRKASAVFAALAITALKFAAAQKGLFFCLHSFAGFSV